MTEQEFSINPAIYKDDRDATIAAQAARIVELETALNEAMVAMARQGANYDTHSTLRKAWQIARNTLYPVKVTK